MKDSLDSLIAAARAQGWTVTRTSKGHWRFVPPAKEGQVVVSSGTPSDHREVLNTRARLRRQGFKG